MFNLTAASAAMMTLTMMPGRARGGGFGLL